MTIRMTGYVRILLRPPFWITLEPYSGLPHLSRLVLSLGRENSIKRRCVVGSTGREDDILLGLLNTCIWL